MIAAGLAVGAAVMALPASAATPPKPAAAAPAPNYATILFGRAQFQQADTNCQPAVGSVPLTKVATDMANLHLSATAAVVVDRTQETTRLCWSHFSLQTSWADLAMLRDQYGWSSISAGQTYENVSTLTAAQLKAESCGSLKAFTAHGQTQAHGLFAYPNNSFSVQAQTVVSTCFDYGRTYRGGINLRAKTTSPWLQNTTSVNGGACNTTTLPCYKIKVQGDRRYDDPTLLAKKFSGLAPDQWTEMQFYRFVTGKHTIKAFSWDCSGTDWHTHFTSNGELYCYNDFLTVMAAIKPTTTVTDPATVAAAWGRHV